LDWTGFKRIRGSRSRPTPNSASWEDVCQIGGLKAAGRKPIGQGDTVLVDRGGWNPGAAIRRVVRPAEHETRVRSVDAAAGDRAHDQRMLAPAVIGSRVSVRLEGAAEVGLGEGDHIPAIAERLADVSIECRHRRAQIGEQTGLSRKLGRVRVVAALGDEVDLTLGAECPIQLDQRRDLRQLAPDIRVREAGDSLASVRQYSDIRKHTALVPISAAVALAPALLGPYAVGA